MENLAKFRSQKKKKQHLLSAEKKCREHQEKGQTEKKNPNGKLARGQVKSMPVLTTSFKATTKIATRNIAKNKNAIVQVQTAAEAVVAVTTTTTTPTTVGEANHVSLLDILTGI